jgi:O-antigen/teichoic acid export membrane protein
MSAPACDGSGHPTSAEQNPRHNSMTRRVVASLLWQASASLVAQTISWFSTLVVIRLLSPDDFGLMAMAGISIGFIMLIGDLGVGAVVVQAPALNRLQLQALFTVALLAYLLGAVVAFASAPVVAAFFAEPRLISIVRALSLSLIFAGLYAVPQALVLRTLEFDRKAKIDVLAALVSSIGALTLAVSGLGAWSLVGAALTTQAFRAAAFQVVRPCVFLPFPPFAALRGMVRFGGLVTLDRILWFGYTNLDMTIAGRALGGALVGVYSVALSLASIPLDKVMSIATQVSFSAFSRSQTDPGAIRRGVVRAMESVSLLAFPTFLGMAAVAPEAIAIFLGPKWTDAVVPFQILCLALPFRAVGLLFAPALFGTGRPRIAVENNAITLAVMAVALLLGVRWGIVGLCVGWLVGYVPVFCVTAYRALATLEIPIGRVVAAIGSPLAATLAMGVGVVGARVLVAEALPPLAALVSLSLLGAGIYGALMATFRPQALRSLWTATVGMVTRRKTRTEIEPCAGS